MCFFKILSFRSTYALSAWYLWSFSYISRIFASKSLCAFESFAL